MTRMGGGCVLVLAGLLCAVRAARADDWSFTPKSAADAAAVASYGLYPSRLVELRPSYLDIRDGGNATSLVLRAAVPMPYVLVPGLRFAKIYSIIRVDLPIVSLNTPAASAVGLADMHIVDGAVKPFRWGAIGFGFGAIFSTATDPALGFGKFELGPGGGVAVWIVRDRLSVSVLAENLFTVAGSPTRPSLDVLLLQPSILLALPDASYLEMEPVLSFNWSRGGRATIPINLAVGHAFSSRFVVAVEPEWIIVGSGKNDVLVRLILSYVGW